MIERKFELHALARIQAVRWEWCIAKLSLNSTQLKLRLRLALFPATHPTNQPPNQESSIMELQIL